MAGILAPAHRSGGHDRPLPSANTRSGDVFMDADSVRDKAQSFADALVAGDVERATSDFSNELRQRLGDVLTLFPLPATEATVVSVDHARSSYNVVISLAGENEDVEVQTRWKDREGRPTIVEASHLTRTARAAQGETEFEEQAEEAGESA
jgi:hypothetical protein